MKGMTLVQLATELERQKNAKRDFIVNTKYSIVEPDDKSPTKLTLKLSNGGEFPIRRHAVRQIGSRLGIPAVYVDRLAEKHPDLLAYNINKLFDREPESRMVRTLDGQTRAFLSDSFRPLDNSDFVSATLPKLVESGCEVISCEITETRLYIKAFRPGVERTVSKPGTFMGDGGHNLIHVFRPGLVLSNSEVGAGSLSVSPGVREDSCSNLLVFSSNAMRKYHVGRSQSVDQEAMWELFTDKTKQASDRAFWLQVQDLVGASLAGEVFDRLVDECEAKMNGTEIVKPSLAVRELKSLSNDEQEGVLSWLIKGGDLSQFGMQAAITRFAQEDAVAYERQVELETFAGSIIELPQTQWETLAQAS